MFKLSAWKPSKSTGELPIEGASAGVWRYRKFIQWSFSIDYLGADQTGGQGIDFKTATGGWKIQFKSGDTVIFEQQVDISITMIAMIAAGFGGATLGLFVWYFNSEKITTTIIDGQPTEHATPPTQIHSYSYVWPLGGNNPTASREFGTMEQGGGSDYTDAGGTVQDWWDSPIYQTTLPAGTTLHIVYDRWQAGTMRSPTYQFAFLELPDYASYFDDLGALRMLTSDNNHHYITHRYMNGRGVVDRNYERHEFANVGEACLCKTADNRMWLLAVMDSVAGLYYTEDDGYKWTKATYTDPSNVTQEDDVQIAPQGASNFDVKASPNGGLYFLWELNRQLYLASSENNYTAISIGPIISNLRYYLAVPEKSHSVGMILVAAPDHQYISMDSGSSWDESESIP